METGPKVYLVDPGKRLNDYIRAFYNSLAQFIVIAVGAVVNAVALSGSNALFSMSTEAEREKGTAASEKFKKI